MYHPNISCCAISCEYLERGVLAVLDSRPCCLPVLALGFGTLRCDGGGGSEKMGNDDFRPSLQVAGCGSPWCFVLVR